MKSKRILVLFAIVLSSVIITTVASATAIPLTNETSVSASNKSKEVFLDPYLQQISSTSPTEVSERLIVMFDPTVNMDLRTQLLSTIDDLEIIQACKIIPGVCVDASLSAIESIKKLDGVKAIWFDHKVRALSIPNQIFSKHKVFPKLSDSVDLINAPSLWELGINGSGIVIAVVDTGINWDHESLDDLDDNPATDDPKVIANASFVHGVPTGFDDHGHGTHVAGIAAGTGGPSHVYMGVAPSAQLYAVKVLDSTGMGYASWVVAGIEWSVENDADIITMSIGGWGYPYDPVSMASDAAVNAGIVVTVAAGNIPYYGAIDSPGLATKVITVGATTKGDTIATFSSKGPNTYDFRGDPDVVAPGVGIMSADAWNSTGYIPMSGTSMATPHVAGGAALLLQAFDGAAPKLIASALMASAVDIGYDSYTQGAGRIDVSGAYNLINKSIEQGFLQLEATYQANSPRANREEVTPRYAWFSNARIEFMVDDFGNVFGLYFDGRDQWATMAWRIAYNTSNLASWLDLEIIQPLMMRVWNETYQQAFGAFRTPDKAAAIFVMVELFGNETWARTSFKVWPMGVTLENLRIFYIEDVGMYMDFEYDWSYYYGSQDIIVVNDTYELAPAQHFGFGGGLPSSAHHVGPYPDAWEAAYYDKLNNETEWIGDDNNAFRWSLGSVSTPTTVPIIFGLHINVSAVFSVINEGRATPLTPFDIIPYPELSVSISGPTIATPDTPMTYTATVSNYWLNDSVGAMLTFYLDDPVVDSLVIDVPSGASIEAPINMSMPMGMHFVTAEIFDPSDPAPQNNIAKKRVFAGIIFSAVLPCELEVNTYTDFGPFSYDSMAWVNLTIITPDLMPDVEIRLTGDLSQVVSFVDSPYLGDVEGWKYFAFEVYASGDPWETYTGFIEILSEGVTVNKLPVTVNVWWNPVPKINSVFLNDTSVLRVTETLGVTINVTDLDDLGEITPPSDISVNIYLLHFDTEWMAWMIIEGPIPAPYNATTGLFEFEYTFPADYSLGMFGIGIEAIDPYYYAVRAMVRPFYVENNIPIASATLSPRNIVGNETVLINVTVSDIETPVEQLQLTASVVTPAGEEVGVQLTLVDGAFTATFNDTSEEGVYLFSVIVTDRDGGSVVKVGYFEVDNTAPSVIILSPKDSSVVSGILNVTFIAWDAKLMNASLIIDNDTLVDVTGTTSLILNTTELPDGQHTVKLLASDLAGNDAQTSLTIIVDNTPPLADINAPISGAYVKDIISVNVTGADANFNRMELYINGILKQTWTESGIQTYDWNTHAYTDGSYTIKLVVYDEAGNMETAETTVTGDNTLPTAEIRKPTENTHIKGSYGVIIYGYDVNLDVIELYVNESLVASWNVTGIHTYTWDTTNDATYTIKLLVKDKAENSVTDTVTVIVDNTKPTVSITSPQDGAGLFGTVKINFAVADTNLKLAQLIIDDNIVLNVTGETHPWDSTKVGDGSHTIKLVAYDTAGNTNETAITVTTTNVKREIEATRNLYLGVGIPVGFIIGAIIVYAITRKKP
ncbi:MAG: S8 family serine peptidase [Candidatus Bathyarchaeia archaeon]|nr:S8 family serine peptidase [Candidatus Bathyarchaeia archaeon]